MKVAFLQKYPFPYFGVMALSASLPAEVEREVFVGDLERDAAAAAAPRPLHPEPIFSNITPYNRI